MDSGAQVSVTPSTLSSTPTSFLSAANGSRIPAWGAVSLPVVLAGKKFGSHSFVRAAVDRPILGADFFESTGLAATCFRPPASRFLFLCMFPGHPCQEALACCARLRWMSVDKTLACLLPPRASRV